jgi:hypothetical protein
MASTTNPLLKQAFWTPKYATANKILTGTDSGTVWANPNATANVTLTLPKATGSGITYGFVQVNAHSMSIAPLTGDTIRGLAASTSFTLTNGSTVTLISVQSGYWDVFPSYFPDGITTGPGGSTLGGVVNFTGTPELNGVQIFNSGSFTGTLTGCTTAPTATIKWWQSGALVTLIIPGLTATSNTTSCTITGVPAALQVTGPNQSNNSIPFIEDNSVITYGVASVGTVITLYKNASTSSASFTAAGTKGIGAGCMFTYAVA